MNRRDFIKTMTLATGAVSFGVPSLLRGQNLNSRLNIAMIGAGGIASMAYGSCYGENIVALCDIDARRLLQHARSFPALQLEKAAQFADFRVMLDRMDKQIDGVCINTPDHTHFAATLASMQAGKHVCTQKPLTHNIWQARTLRLAARKYPVVTNMANQGHTFAGIRQMKECLEAGILGQVSEIYCGDSTNPNWQGPYFRRPKALPFPPEPVPKGVDWDLWAGPVPDSSYSNYLHPLSWRTYYKYGGGLIADLFCHVADGAVWGLDLYEPTVIECVDRRMGNLPEVCPDSSLIRWDFPARGNQVPCKLYWIDGTLNGGQRIKVPPEWNWQSKDADGRVSRIEPPNIGSFFFGDKSTASLDIRSDNFKLCDMQKHRQLKATGFPAQKYPRIKGGPHSEWIAAIKKGAACGSRFEYSARLTEVALLGVLAQHYGGRIEWDAAHMKITNRPELNEYLTEPTRSGWEYGKDLWT